MCTKDQSSNKDIGICMYEKKGWRKTKREILLLVLILVITELKVDQSETMIYHFLCI